MKRFAEISSPRVRIAPSPTGKLHIGTARTALFNWLFAKKNGGIFVLRIEDTDRERSASEFERDILDNLRWLGLNWDEGPDIGGRYGPYRQSERGELYAEYIKRLLISEKAYYCFCSEEELEDERQIMLRQRMAPKYSGKCRKLSPQDVKNSLESGKSGVIRLKMPAQKIVIEDIIRGKVVFDTELLGDIAIAKSETNPFYNFAVVIDDELMKITHVLRGEDHLSNTPKQWMVAELLGLKHPVYGHFPLILGPDRSKLSKRHGAVSVEKYRQDGYLPEALVNFMALLGWHSDNDREIFTPKELVEQFSIERIQKAGAIFDITKLDWLNGQYIRKKSEDELLDLVLPYWIESGLLRRLDDRNFFAPKTGENVNRDMLRKIVALERERIKKLSDAVPAAEYFFSEPSYSPELLVWKNATLEETIIGLEKAIFALNALSAEEFTALNVAGCLEALWSDDKGKILWPVRVALSGRAASPGPFDLAEILGKSKTLKRLEHARTILSA